MRRGVGNMSEDISTASATPKPPTYQLVETVAEVRNAVTAGGGEDGARLGNVTSDPNHLGVGVPISAVKGLAGSAIRKLVSPPS